jgi:manganese/zinc/iron transport system substrate-binding protein
VTKKEPDPMQMQPLFSRVSRDQKARYLSLFLTVALTGLIVSGCGSDTLAAPSGDLAGRPIRVVTTTGMIADVVANVGGDRVEVTQLMGPGVDPHLYRATESDVHRLSGADIIFYNGLNLEARMTTIFEQIGRSRPAVAVGTAVPVEQLLLDPDYEDQPDPHIWMDVKLWLLVVEKVRDELITLDQEHEATYRANAERYRQQLEELEAYVQEQVNQVPAEQRLLVTAHDAFNYFGRGYGFEVYAPQGISTESEAGIDDIRQTIDLVVGRNIPAIFIETSVPPDIVEAIVAGARSRGHEIAIGGELFSDAMGATGTPEGTYIGMIRHNTDTIVEPYKNEP